MTTQQQDFGFSGEEFTETNSTPPYCQFNRNGELGLAITQDNAELAEFRPSTDWTQAQHRFSGGEEQLIYVTQTPRMVILNRTRPMMSDGNQIIPYSKDIYNQGGYQKPFSYAVVWFLDQHNQPLSKLPFRLKSSGWAGYTFNFNYSYFDNSNSFCQKFLEVYQQLAKQPKVRKNQIFYAHAIYHIKLAIENVKSRQGQTNTAVVTKTFLQPTLENFSQLIIPNGSPTSLKIQELIESTKPWLKTEVYTN